MQLEALQLQSGTQRQSCTVVALAIAVGDLHLAGASEVIACRHIDVLAQQQVGTYRQVLDESLVPVVQSRQGPRQA